MEYELSQLETETLKKLNNQAVVAKLRLLNAKLEMEAAQRATEQSGAAWGGALTILAESRGMDGGVLSPDFTKFTKE